MEGCTPPGTSALHPLHHVLIFDISLTLPCLFDEQVRFITKLLQNKFTLSGMSASGMLGMTQAYSGFVICYELLAKKLDIRLLKDDSPHTLACLLARMLPPGDALEKGLLMSLIRAMCLNREAVLKLPGFHQEQVKAKERAVKKNAKTNVLQKITGAIKGAFDDANFTLDFLTLVTKTMTDDQHAQPGTSWCFTKFGERKPTYSPKQMVEVTALALSERLLYGWLAPALSDFSCEKRVFRPVSARGVTFDANDVSALSSTPMAPLGLKDCLADMSCMAPEQAPLKKVDPNEGVCVRGG